MWIVTDKGFVSLVVDKREPDLMQVRARVREDITNNFPGAVVYTSDAGDYRYRARVRKTEVAVVIAQQVMDMTYTSHFKDVALAKCPNPASRRTAYYGVWGAMAKMQDYAPYSKYSRAEDAKRPSYGYVWDPVTKGYVKGAPVTKFNDGSRWHDDDSDALQPYGSNVLYGADAYESPKGWDLPVDTDWDLPDIEDLGDDDPEVEEAIREAEQILGKATIDALSEDEWIETLDQIIRTNRENLRTHVDDPQTRTSSARRRDRRRGKGKNRR